MELLSQVEVVIEPTDHPVGTKVDEELVILVGPEVKLSLGVEDGARWVGELGLLVEQLRRVPENSS